MAHRQHSASRNYVSVCVCSLYNSEIVPNNTDECNIKHTCNEEEDTRDNKLKGVQPWTSQRYLPKVPKLQLLNQPQASGIQGCKCQHADWSRNGWLLEGLYQVTWHGFILGSQMSNPKGKVENHWKPLKTSIPSGNQRLQWKSPLNGHLIGKLWYIYI